MNILLITPENAEIKQFRRWQFNNFTQITMPYLAGFINETQYRITLIDEYNQRIPYNRPFDLVAITVNTPNATHCYQMAARFRAQGAKVIMGGPHATLRPAEVSRHCDHLAIGEAEETWPQFLDDFYHHRAREHYACERTPSLSSLPIPRRDLIGRRTFTKGAVFATRGCPFNCSYCNLKQIYCPEFRVRPIPEVITDIQSMQTDYFVFWDDNFFGDPDYTRQLLHALKSVKKRWAAQVSVDRCQDETLLRLAHAAGCVYLFLGLESFSPDSLASVNKGFNRVTDYQRIIALIHRCNISVQAGVIFGFDHDGPDVFAHTLQACEQLGLDGATASLLTPLPGTHLFDAMQAQGRLLSKDWADYNGKTRVAFRPARMTPDELFRGYTWFRQQFYSFASTFRRLRASGANPVHSFILNSGYKLSLKRTLRHIYRSNCDMSCDE
jgi:radical SAM superfamily enzyme YgiQ (UPF0313 family)